MNVPSREFERQELDFPDVFETCASAADRDVRGFSDTTSSTGRHSIVEHSSSDRTIGRHDFERGNFHREKWSNVAERRSRTEDSFFSSSSYSKCDDIS